MKCIAVLSTAHIHVPAYLEFLASDQVPARVGVIWDDIPERGRYHARQFNVPFAEDIQSVLLDENIDGFLICNETTRHLNLLEHVLPLGKPVMCEKALAATSEHARRIHELIKIHRTPMVSGYWHPYDPVNRAVFQVIQSGQLGKVTHAHYRCFHSAAYDRVFDGTNLQWFTDPLRSGGGALIDLGTHAVHFLRLLFGPVTEVWAFTANLSGNYPDVDDYGLIQMRFANGLLGRSEAAWCHRGGINGLEVFGTQQSIWSTADGLVMGMHSKKSRPLPARNSEPAFMPRLGLHRLVALINNQLDPDAQAQDIAAALDAVVIMAAAYQSAQTQRWVAVPSLQYQQVA